MKFKTLTLINWTAWFLLLLGYLLRFDLELNVSKRLDIPPSKSGSDSYMDWDNRTHDFYFNLNIQPSILKEEINVIEWGTDKGAYYVQN